jgi:hypothetical protein
MLIYIAALLNQRWVWHVKLHGNLPSMIIHRRNGNGARSKKFLERLFGYRGGGLVRCRRPLFLLLSFSIVGSISDSNLRKVGNATNLFRLDINDLQGRSDDKIPREERCPGTGRLIGGDAVHDESGSITDCIVWRRQEFTQQGKSRVAKCVRRICSLRLQPHVSRWGLLRRRCGQGQGSPGKRQQQNHWVGFHGSVLQIRYAETPVTLRGSRLRQCSRLWISSLEAQDENALNATLKGTHGVPPTRAKPSPNRAAGQ